MSSKGLHDVTSSPASEDGSSPLIGPDSRESGLFGQALVPASRSAISGFTKASTTSAMCGRLGGISSPSADLQRSLASRLQAKTDLNGSPEYLLSWKLLDIKSREPICVLRASPRPTPEVGFIGELRDLDQTPTKPPASSPALFAAIGLTSKSFVSTVAPTVAVTGWITPTARDYKDTPNMSYLSTNPDSSTRVRVDHLPRQAGTVVLTPDASSRLQKKDGTYKSGVALNPELSRWLMGYPKSWASAAKRC